MTTIAALVLTYNEEANIGRCLEALTWCDDIVVVDSFSQDSTVARAEPLARVYQRAFRNFADQRNFGSTECGIASDWILHIDADEIVEPPLKAEILRVVGNGQYDAYRVAQKMIFEGKWIRHASMYPTYQVRLGRRDVLTFRQIGHGQRECMSSERIGTLREGLRHECFSKGLSDWIDKHNRYASTEAEEAFSGLRPWRTVFRDLVASGAEARWRALKQVRWLLPCRPFLRFFFVYVVRMGFLDGMAGLRYAKLMAVYQLMTDMKLLERRRASLPRR